MQDYKELLDSENPETNLYRTKRFRDRVDRANKLQEELGRKLTVEELITVDHLAYTGKPELDRWMKDLENKPAQLLDVGSGVGGPARYVAKTLGCTVTALEYQKINHDDALELHDFIKDDLEAASGNVEYVCGDVLNMPEEWTNKFDGFFSNGALFHLVDKHALFKSLKRVLKPGAVIFIDDFISVIKNEETKEHFASLYAIPGGEVPYKWEYMQSLEENEFEVLEFLDIEKHYAKHYWGRFEKFLRNTEGEKKRWGDEYQQYYDKYLVQCKAVPAVKAEDYPTAWDVVQKCESKVRFSGAIIYGRKRV